MVMKIILACMVAYALYSGFEAYPEYVIAYVLGSIFLTFGIVGDIDYKDPIGVFIVFLIAPFLLLQVIVS